MAFTVPEPGSLAVPGPGEVQVWFARIDAGGLSDELRERLAGDLDDATLARAKRYLRAEDRDRALAAHSLLRRLLAAVSGDHPARLVLGTRCGHCGSTEHGKPYLATPEPVVEVNLSHSGPIVCVALAGPGTGVGIDVEARRGVDWTKLRSSVFADSEWEVTAAAADPDRARTDHWARKESAVKSCGWGLSMGLSKVVVTADDEGAWTALLTDGVGTAEGRDVPMGDDVSAAVAVHRPAGFPENGPMAAPLVRFVTFR